MCDGEMIMIVRSEPCIIEAENGRSHDFCFYEITFINNTLIVHKCSFKISVIYTIIDYNQFSIVENSISIQLSGLLIDSIFWD